MSGDLMAIQIGLDTIEFVENFKRLVSCSTIDEYSLTIDRLIEQLNEMKPNELIECKPLILALIEHFHRIIPILNQRIADGHCQTNVLLKIIGQTLNTAGILNVFFSIKDTSRFDLIFQHYFPFLKDKTFIEHLRDVRFDELNKCFLPLVTFSFLFVTFEENEFLAELVNSLLEFADENWCSSQRESVMKTVLSMIKILCKIPTIVTLILRSAWPKKCLCWLTAKVDRRPSFEIDFYICLILQKLARHTAGVEVLTELNCLQLLVQSQEQMKKDHSEDEFNLINFTQSIIYALLVESNEIKQKTILNDRFLLKVLKELISCIVQASQTQKFIYKGCHIAEMLCVLSKLFVNDDIVEKCFTEQPDLFDGLCRLLLRFIMVQNETSKYQQTINDEALAKLVNLFWSISFHPSFHEKFKSNSVLMHTLANLATSSSLYVSSPMKTNPTDIFPLKQAAEGILWNLKSTKSIKCPRKSVETSSIMISYSHSDDEFCRQLVEHLSPHVSVWVDYQQLNQHVNSDDLWEDIARAMESATTIVLILSKEYYHSKSCRQELSYASDALKKRILPIYAPNQDYKASGWLGIRIAGQKYVHFGRKTFQNALNELLSLIVHDQKPIDVVHRESTTKDKEENSFDRWTSKEIQRWFVENHVHPDLIALFENEFHTGTALLAYAQHLKHCYQIEYEQIVSNYQTKFNGKILQTVHFVTFVDALWRLREKYDEKVSSSKPICIKKKQNVTWF